MLLLTPAASRPLLAEAPLTQETDSSTVQTTRASTGRDTVTLPNLMPIQQLPVQMSVQSFVPPRYAYQPLPERPTTVEFWQQVGHNAVLAQDYANAVVAFDKALELSVDTKTELYMQRGWAHYLNQNEAEAIVDLKKAASLYLENQAFDRYINARRMAGFISNQDIASGSVAKVGQTVSGADS